MTRSGDGLNPPANIIVHQISTLPQNINTGQSSGIRVKAENIGGMTGECIITVEKNGVIKLSRTLILYPGEVKDIHFDFPAEEAGNYVIKANNDTSIQLSVDQDIETDTNGEKYLRILIAFCGLAFFTSTVLLVRRRSINSTS